jgi:nitrogen fixation/metabolism regulation signal transduction histidine kinase
MNEPIANYSDKMMTGRYGIKKELVAFITLVSILALLLLGLLTAISADAQFLSQYFVWLYTVNVVVGILLLLVIVGLVINLTLRLRQGYFGTKLIVKLAMIFGLVGVLPGAILYSVSLQFVGRSIESWFDVNIELALEAGLELGRSTFEISQREFLESGERFRSDYSITTIQKNFELKNLCNKIDADQISIIDQSNHEFFSVNCGHHEIIDTVINTDTFAELNKSGKTSLIKDVGTANAESYQLNAFYMLPNQKILRLEKLLTPTLVENAKLVQKAYSDYQEKSLSRLGLKKMYIGSLTLTMFLALFIALLLALILGRQLARPLLMLLRGTQAVAQGDLSPKPQMETPDELGELTRQFNNMTKQLSDARKSLQESKDFSESVLANLTAGVCVFDASYRLLIANEGAKRILEKDITQLIGKPLSFYPELLHFEKTIKESFTANQVSVGADDSTSILEIKNIGTNEKSWQRQIHLYDDLQNQENVSPILLARGTELQGKQYIIVFDDITEVIVAQRSIAWGEVAQRLAHEIKNPLTPIQLSAERIFQKLTGKLAIEQEEIVLKATNTIISQVQAMKTMVNNFRDFGKKPSLKMQAINLNQLILEILGLYEGTQIELILDQNAPDILGDATQLRQVIHNILQNSIDAATEVHSEPEIQIRTEVVNYVGLVNQTEKLVRLSVADNGPGFSPRILTRAFEPYVTSKTKGTGLGLAVVKKIIDEHGARIELKNRMRDKVIRGARISILFERLA